jgi:hypothetical protein
MDPRLADAILGDLAEQRARRARTDGPMRATLWYWSALLRSPD